MRSRSAYPGQASPLTHPGLSSPGLNYSAPSIVLGLPENGPAASKTGPHYAAAAQLSGPGTYHLTYIVSPPSTHGMMRQTDKVGGVPDWWKPIQASWTFTYPLASQ